jgi:hypothetical protein
VKSPCRGSVLLVGAARSASVLLVAAARPSSLPLTAFQLLFRADPGRCWSALRDRRSHGKRARASVLIASLIALTACSGGSSSAGSASAPSTSSHTTTTNPTKSTTAKGGGTTASAV